MKTTAQLSREDFQEAHDDETASRNALGLGLFAVLAFGALAVLSYFLPLVIV